MKGIKNRILYEVQNYQSVLNTKADCEHLSDALTIALIREMKSYLYTLDISAELTLRIANDLNALKGETKDKKFTENELRKAVQMARHTVSNEDQIIKNIENGAHF